MIQNETKNKLNLLREYLGQLKNTAVAFSGGVDSSLLLAVASEVLGKNVIAVTARSAFFSKRELNESERFCESLGVRQIFADCDVLRNSCITENPVNRCYLCKKDVFSKIISCVRENNFSSVCEGTNADDLSDFRPGMQAVKELGVKSPLLECGFHKAEIRELLSEMKFSVAAKPSMACLASRIPYGEEITAAKLMMVEKAENFLKELGAGQVRVRLHGENLCRIEVPEGEMQNVFAQREKIVSEFSSLGFKYVSLDLCGYRTGSLNEVL